MAADRSHVGKGGVYTYGIGQDKAVSLPVLGHICDLMADGVVHRIQMDFFSLNKKLSRNIGTVALSENAHGQLRTPRSHKPADSHHFPFVHMNRHMVHHLPVRVQGMVYHPVPDLQGSIADVDILPPGEPVCQLTSHHSLYDPVL